MVQNILLLSLKHFPRIGEKLESEQTHVRAKLFGSIDVSNFFSFESKLIFRKNFNILIYLEINLLLEIIFVFDEMNFSVSK